MQFAATMSPLRIFKSFFSVTIAAAVISVICSLTGILVAILAGTPVGSTIVAADILVFFYGRHVSGAISLYPDERTRKKACVFRF